MKKMPEEEYRIRLYFMKHKACSLPYLMKTYKISKEKAYEYLETLSYMANKWTKNDEGKIVGVFRK
jgi:hypothetical protein